MVSNPRRADTSPEVDGAGWIDMSNGYSSEEVELLRKERDLYRKLLELGEHEELEMFLQEALHLFIEVAGARRGYIELRQHDPPSTFHLEQDAAQIGNPLMSDFSRSIVDAAFQDGRTVMTASAVSDPRFRDKASVRDRRLEAVLCAPIGEPPLGVVYLQDRLRPEPFSTEDRERAELFACHVANFAKRLLIQREQARGSDPTARYRAALNLDAIVGTSHALAQVFERVSALAPFDGVAVLLTGPSGTGKTQLARVIHTNSKRVAMPFIEVSCANLPEALLENELFGAVKGGHATASGPVIGKVAAAEGGTLFLDEIGELTLAAQAKLLQLLQSRTYFALGSAKSQHADVRVIAATNRDLEAAIKTGGFREDLYYRLNTFPIRMPALAERAEDIPALARNVCQQFCERHGLPSVLLSAAALRTLQASAWVGNIRELVGAVERAAILARSQGLLQIDSTHLDEQRAPTSAENASSVETTFAARVESYKRQLVLDALQDNAWNIAQTARSLGLARAHVYNLLQMLGIQRPANA
jgi:transcriptional regulator with GAF, ATPase, and Fis domain